MSQLITLGVVTSVAVCYREFFLLTYALKVDRNNLKETKSIIYCSY